MRRWTLDLTEHKQDMVETLDYWTGLLISNTPLPHAKVLWDYDKIGLSWLERPFLENQSYLYGKGDMPQLKEISFWVYLSKKELMPFMSENGLVIEVYETAEGMEGDIVLAVNGVPVRKENKRLLVERTKTEEGGKT